MTCHAVLIYGHGSIHMDQVYVQPTGQRLEHLWNVMEFLGRPGEDCITFHRWSIMIYGLSIWEESPGCTLEWVTWEEWLQQALMVLNVLPSGDWICTKFTSPHCQDSPCFTIGGMQVSWGIGMGDGQESP